MPKEKIEMMIKLAASIEPSLKTFEDDGNYVKVRFKDNKTPKEQIIEDLHLVGIKEIDSIRSNKDCHVFTLKFRGTSQRKIIEDLEERAIRMSALKALNGWGGIKPTAEEQKFFDKENAKFAALKMRKTQND